MAVKKTTELFVAIGNYPRDDSSRQEIRPGGGVFHYTRSAFSRIVVSVDEDLGLYLAGSMPSKISTEVAFVPITSKIREARGAALTDIAGARVMQEVVEFRTPEGQWQGEAAIADFIWGPSTTGRVREVFGKAIADLFDKSAADAVNRPYKEVEGIRIPHVTHHTIPVLKSIGLERLLTD